ARKHSPCSRSAQVFPPFSTAQLRYGSLVRVHAGLGASSAGRDEEGTVPRDEGGGRRATLRLDSLHRAPDSGSASSGGATRLARSHSHSRARCAGSTGNLAAPPRREGPGAAGDGGGP